MTSMNDINLGSSLAKENYWTKLKSLASGWNLRGSRKDDETRKFERE